MAKYPRNWQREFQTIILHRNRQLFLTTIKYEHCTVLYLLEYQLLPSIQVTIRNTLGLKLFIKYPLPSGFVNERLDVGVSNYVIKVAYTYQPFPPHDTLLLTSHTLCNTSYLYNLHLPRLSPLETPHQLISPEHLFLVTCTSQSLLCCGPPRQITLTPVYIPTWPTS